MAFVAVVTVAVVAFASLGGVGLAQSAVGLAQYQYGKKVTVCHKGKHAIRISTRAWPAHKRHGDTIGACAERTKHAKKEHGTSASEHGKKAEHAGATTATVAVAKRDDDGQRGKSADKGQSAKGAGNGGKDHGGKRNN